MDDCSFLGVLRPLNGARYGMWGRLTSLGAFPGLSRVHFPSGGRLRGRVTDLKKFKFPLRTPPRSPISAALSRALAIESRSRGSRSEASASGEDESLERCFVGRCGDGGNVSRVPEKVEPKKLP